MVIEKPKDFRYKIAFVTSINPRDKKRLSGSPYYILTALENFVGDVEVIGPVKYNTYLFNFLKRISLSFRKKYNLNHSFYLSRKYAKAFHKLLKNKNFDFIFASRSSTEIALLRTKIPIIYYSDTTFKTLYNYYEWFSHFLKISVWEGNRIEKLSIEKSLISIFSSDWAANSAIEDYAANPKKVFVIPFGPNVDEVPAFEDINFRKDNSRCNLVFIGVEWERKGGEIAFDALIELKKKGLNSHLSIIGCVPPENISDNDMSVIPFLDKNDKKQSKEFNNILNESHFLLLPTRQECFGIVFCEASSFGLPSISTDTGGISGAIINNVNGFRLPLSAKGADYANLIYEIFTDYDNKYLPLAKSSRECYETKLNWKSWSDSLKQILNQHLNTHI